MNLSAQLLSDITVYSKYARYVQEQKRRETWDEIIDRVVAMHCKKYPNLEQEIVQTFDKFVRPKYVLPSMRSLQFAGKPIELSPNRIMNCGAMPMDDIKAFRELMFLLLGGTGVGFSVQRSHIKKLPTIKKPIGKVRYVLQDSIIGWSDAVHVLMKAYFYGARCPEFDFSDIRARGTPLRTSGGKAPGSEELQKSLEKMREVLDTVAYGQQLSSLQVHDLCCLIAAAVLSGGIRRSAMMSLFDFDDELMINAKSGDWVKDHPHRQYANNSAMTLRYKARKKDILSYIDNIRETGWGEPSLYFANDCNSLTNPCAEASVNLNFCNLTTYNMSAVESNSDLFEFAGAAALLGTLQAGYTNFHYLRPVWQEKTEKESLLGVSCTGVARRGLFEFDFVGAAKLVREVNKAWAKKLGINPAYRCTVNKPEGTSSAVLGTGSGVHAYHAKKGLRRTRYMYDEPLVNYLQKVAPNLVEVDHYDSNRRVLSLPFEAPDDAILRSEESALDLLERVKFMSQNWVKPGHAKGHNGHSVSATIYVKDNEWDEVAEWMWKNKNDYNGLSILPYSGGKFKQAPFEEVSAEQHAEVVKQLPKDFDLSKVREEEDFTTLKQEVACSGGQCEIL